MPRNGSGVYSLPGTYEAVTGEQITSLQHNAPLEDLESDANDARPIAAGGTGATSKAAAQTALDILPTTGGTVTGPIVIGTAGSLSFEGATANDHETTLAATDPTADRTITLPDATGTVLLDTTDVVVGTGKVITFEGATADANETTLTAADPTADRTITLPDASGTVLVSGADVALEAGKVISFEGATADAHETTLTATDPTADRTITLPDATGTVLLDTTDVVVGTGKVITFEGATANAYETTLTATDPTADRTITFPDATGTVLLDTTGSLLTHTGATLVNGVTSYDITGIPSTASVIFINLYNMNFGSGTDDVLIQLGDSGGIETSGYTSNNASTSGFVLELASDSEAANGLVTLSKLGSDGLRWMVSGGVTVNGTYHGVAGTKAVSAALDRIRVTRSAAGGTFENAYISIAYI